MKWHKSAWNLAHGTSTKVVSNLAEIVKMRRTSVPYTISKYVERPFLISSCHGRVKFDFRYHIIVRSFCPLEAYAMKRFWPKLASKSYDLEVNSLLKSCWVITSQKINDVGRHLTNIAISEERNQPDYRDFQDAVCRTILIEKWSYNTHKFCLPLIDYQHFINRSILSGLQ